MVDFFDFVIICCWLLVWLDVIQFYMLNMFNGIKILVMFEECGLVYDVYCISISDLEDQFMFEFLLLNFNNKIFVMIDLNGLGGQLIGLFEIGVMLIYLGDKIGQFLFVEGVVWYYMIQWLMWQMGGLGLMFGQVGYFYCYKGFEIEDLCFCICYYNEVWCILGVLDCQFDGCDWIIGEYFIVDMVVVFWLCIVWVNYQVEQEIGMDGFVNVQVYLEWFLVCFVVQCGIEVGVV